MRISGSRLLAVALLLAVFSNGFARAQSRRRRASSPGQFSYYLLVLSYAPDFCDQPQGNKSARECGSGRRVGFVVHGLWPQGENSRGPERCAPASPVSSAIVQVTLHYIPTESLIQHEWVDHGTCSGLTAAGYFADLRKARDSVTLPAAFGQPDRKLQLTPAEVESQLAAANPSFPRSAFRTSCYRDGELEEIRVCLNKDLSPRACGSSADECAAPTVTLLPVR